MSDGTRVRLKLLFGGLTWVNANARFPPKADIERGHSCHVLTLSPYPRAVPGMTLTFVLLVFGSAQDEEGGSRVEPGMTLGCTRDDERR